MEQFAGRLGGLDRAAQLACTAPDFAKLPPDLPRDPEQLLTLCLDSIREAGTKANAQQCALGTDPFYRDLVRGCELAFLRAR